MFPQIRSPSLILNIIDWERRIKRACWNFNESEYVQEEENNAKQISVLYWEYYPYYPNEAAALIKITADQYQEQADAMRQIENDCTSCFHL